MKKVFLIFLTALLLISSTAICISAVEPVKVSLNGATQAIKGDTYEVTLTIDSPENAGGVSGEIEYDENSFSIENANISSSIATANKIGLDEGLFLTNASAGIIKFVIISDNNTNNLLTINFTTKDDANTELVSFMLKNVKVSDTEGSVLVENLTTSIENSTNVYEKALDVKGATVRTNGEADIRFEADFSDVFNSIYRADIAEVGVIAIPTAFIATGQELTLDGTYSGAKAKVAKISGKDLWAETTTISTKLRYSSSTPVLLRTKYSARAYIKLNDGTVIYSDNKISNNNIVGGTSSRSCIDVIRAIAANNGITDANLPILSADDAAWTVENYKTVIDAVNAKLYPEV